MISATELYGILDAYERRDPDIRVANDLMRRNKDGTYDLYRGDGIYTVKGLGWGYGKLFVVTKEKGTTGIWYPHEALKDELAEDGDEGECLNEALNEGLNVALNGQVTLDRWLE